MRPAARSLGDRGGRDGHPRPRSVTGAAHRAARRRRPSPGGGRDGGRVEQRPAGGGGLAAPVPRRHAGGGHPGRSAGLDRLRLRAHLCLPGRERGACCGGGTRAGAVAVR
jgi:hypothetical protein